MIIFTLVTIGLCDRRVKLAWVPGGKRLAENIVSVAPWFKKEQGVETVPGADTSKSLLSQSICSPTVTVAEAERPTPPFAEVTMLVVFVYSSLLFPVR